MLTDCNVCNDGVSFFCRCPGLLRGQPQSGGRGSQEDASGQTNREEPRHLQEDLQRPQEGQTQRCVHLRHSQVTRKVPPAWMSAERWLRSHVTPPESASNFKRVWKCHFLESLGLLCMCGSGSEKKNYQISLI